MSPKIVVLLLAALVAVVVGVKLWDAPSDGSSDRSSEGTAKSGADVASAQELPEHLRVLTERYSARPLSSVALMASEKDREALLASYRSSDALTTKRGLTWALAYIGNETVFEAFRETLLRDYGGKKLDNTEESVLTDTPVAMGFLAGESDQAFEFLQGASNPRYWRDAKSWTSSRGDYSADLLTSFSIQGLGTSGRAEVPAVLDELRKRDANYLHRFAGDIAQAAFYHHIRTTRGVDFLKKNFVKEIKDDRLFTEWSAGAGRGIYKWANDVTRGPRPPEPPR